MVACNEEFTQRAQRAIAKNAKEVEQAKHAKLHYWKTAGFIDPNKSEHPKPDKQTPTGIWQRTLLIIKSILQNRYPIYTRHYPIAPDWPNC